VHTLDAHKLLRATACNASRVLAVVEMSVRLSVRPSHPWALSKRCKLGWRNLHLGQPRWI